MSNHYVTNEHLAKLVRDAQKDGVSEEFALLVGKIARGLHQRMRFHCDVDDYQADCLMMVYRKLHTMDPTNDGLFNFITTLCSHVFFNQYRDSVRRKGYLRKYCREYLRKKSL